MLKSWNPKRPGTHRELAATWLGDSDDLAAYSDAERPRTRAECIDGIRPCPFVGCRYSLYLDVNPKNGVIKFNHPHLEPSDMPPNTSCALDVADAHPGGVELAQMPALTGLSYSRSYQAVDEAKKRAREVAAEIVEAPWCEPKGERGGK